MTRSKLPSFLLATWLLGTIATKSRMSDFLQSLQEYEIVYPRVIPNESAWNRRSTHEDRETWREYLHQEPVFLEISNWTLRTMANDRLILSSNFTVNWVRQGKTKSERRNAKANCDLRQGSLEEDASSFVVVTICEEEVYALMLIGQRSFFVQPLTNGQHVMFQPKNEKWWSIRNNSSFVSVNPENPAGKSNKFEVEESKRKSKRSKRDSLSHDVQGFYNLSGDVFDVEYPEAEKLILYDEKDDVSTEYNDTIAEELSIDVNPVEKCSVGMTASY